MDLDQFKVDEKLTEEGVWCEVGDAKLKIARYGNKKFQRALERGMAPYKRLAQQGRLDDEVVKDVLVKAMARHVLLGWENLSMGGKAIDYSTENAEALLSDPKLTDFRELVIGLSQESDQFRETEVDEVVEK